jgi:hypothetical protein
MLNRASLREENITTLLKLNELQGRSEASNAGIQSAASTSRASNARANTIDPLSTPLRFLPPEIQTMTQVEILRMPHPVSNNDVYAFYSGAPLPVANQVYLLPSLRPRYMELFLSCNVVEITTLVVNWPVLTHFK